MAISNCSPTCFSLNRKTFRIYVCLVVILLSIFIVSKAEAQSGETIVPIIQLLLNDEVTFTISLNANCNGFFNDLRVIFDNQQIAVLVPGEEITFQTTVGQHTIEGLANNGISFGPVERDIDSRGGSQSFLCA